MTTTYPGDQTLPSNGSRARGVLRSIGRLIRRAPLSAFWGVIAGMAAVLTVAIRMPWIAFLWHNLIGAVVVVTVGMAISYMQHPGAVVVRSDER